jgi:hypothetical protein
MPSLTWFGKAMALLVSVQTMASLCLLSVQDICMLIATLWKTMQSTSFTLSTGMFTNFVKLMHELNCENICMNEAGLIISRLLEEPSLATTFLRCLFIFILPLHISALAGHFQAEYTIIFGKLLWDARSLIFSFKSSLFSIPEMLDGFTYFHIIAIYLTWII